MSKSTRRTFDRVYVEKHENVALIMLNDPEHLNPMSRELLVGLWDALQYVAENDHGFRAIVLSGEGKGFCSGADLSGSVQHSGIGSALEVFMHPLLRHFRHIELPVVCAVNGAAAGVGMSLALCADLVLAARSAYFLQAFARISLVPDGGSTWLLPRLIGLARAKELSMLAEKLPAEKALSWGLINGVFDDTNLLPEALKLGERLAQGPTKALVGIKHLYTQSPSHSFEDQLDLEQRVQSQQMKTEDFSEGVLAFWEKRTANFKGR